MALVSIRVERQYFERPERDVLFEWFPELNGIDHSFNQSVFAENRSRLLAVAEQARQRGLPSAGRFSVDGTVLIPRHGKSLDIAAEFPAPSRESAVWRRPAKKDPWENARLCFAVHLLTDDRRGLVVDMMPTAVCSRGNVCSSVNANDYAQLILCPANQPP